MPDKIVNHFVLADGSTAKYSAEHLAGDIPEVVGIRTGYDGTMYESAGDAVRGQVENNHSDIELLRSGGTKNIFNEDLLLLITGATRNGDEYTFTASNATTASENGLLPLECEENTQYTISGYVKCDNGTTTNNGLQIGFNYSDGTRDVTTFTNNQTEFLYFSGRSRAGKSITTVRINYSNAGANSWTVKQLQVEKGLTATEYVNYYTANDLIAREKATQAVKTNSNIISDTSVYSSYNDLPINEIVTIPYNVQLTEAPDGYAYIGHGGGTSTGYYYATVATIADNNTNPAQVVQICYQYRDIYDYTKQPRVSTRYGLNNNGSIVWGDWSTVSQDSVLHSSNRVVDLYTYETMTFGDFNDAPVNSIYQVDLNTGTTVLNNPAPGQSGLLMTFAFSPITRHALVQQHFALGNDDNVHMYVRYSYKQSENDFRWTAWREVAFV